MKSDSKKSGIELLKTALIELIANPTAKINMNSVAKHAGVNHSLFRKPSYQEIKLDILTAQEKRDAELRNRSKEEQIHTLETRLKTANNKLERLANESTKSSQKTIKEIEGAMMAYLTEMYRFNDLLQDRLAIKFNEKIDMETGEVIEISFEKHKQ